jgi:hypothetical protein
VAGDEPVVWTLPEGGFAVMVGGDEPAAEVEVAVPDGGPFILASNKRGGTRDDASEWMNGD